MDFVSDELEVAAVVGQNAAIKLLDFRVFQTESIRLRDAQAYSGRVAFVRRVDILADVADELRVFDYDVR